MVEVYCEIRRCGICGNRAMRWRTSNKGMSGLVCPDDNEPMEQMDAGYVELDKIKNHKGHVNSIEHLRKE